MSEKLHFIEIDKLKNGCFYLNINYFNDAQCTLM